MYRRLVLPAEHVTRTAPIAKVTKLAIRYTSATGGTEHARSVAGAKHLILEESVLRLAPVVGLDFGTKSYLRQ